MSIDHYLNQTRAANRSPELYLCPRGLLTGAVATRAIVEDIAQPFGSDAKAFGFVEIVWRDGAGGTASELLSVSDFGQWLDSSCPVESQVVLASRYGRLRQPGPAWVGSDLSRPLVMGIVNVTPDSFSDGGDHCDPESAIRHGLALIEAGADLLDIGGESTRPGATPVSTELESTRVLPVIRALAGRGIILSIDTRDPRVMALALDAGAKIINDVNALRAPGALELAIERKAPVILMHMRGEPQTMQDAPIYETAALDVWDFLDERLSRFEAAGGTRSMALIDPGIGFGKTAAQNMEILRHLSLYRSLGTGVLLGASRKRLIEHYGGAPAAPKQRLGGSLALALDAVTQGAGVLRVHDVAETVQALRLWQALGQAE